MRGLVLGDLLAGREPRGVRQRLQHGVDGRMPRPLSVGGHRLVSPMDRANRRLRGRAEWRLGAESARRWAGARALLLRERHAVSSGLPGSAFLAGAFLAAVFF